eukprot:1133518-Pleurochrysis_carterae.AAC.1
MQRKGVPWSAARAHIMRPVAPPNEQEQAESPLSAMHTREMNKARLNARPPSANSSAQHECSSLRWRAAAWKASIPRC